MTVLYLIDILTREIYIFVYISQSVFPKRLRNCLPIFSEVKAEQEDQTVTREFRYLRCYWSPALPSSRHSTIFFYRNLKTFLMDKLRRTTSASPAIRRSTRSIMAPGSSIQRPYSIASLPRPVNQSTGRYVVGDVHGGTRGSRKRKRTELAVGIDGEGLNLYDVSIIGNAKMVHFSTSSNLNSRSRNPDLLRPMPFLRSRPSHVRLALL